MTGAASGIAQAIAQAFVREGAAVAVLEIMLLCFLPQAARADSVAVFNEIMYHPATNEPALEWIELYNQNAVDVDVGGWRLSGGMDYVFPVGTVIKGGGHLVVAVEPATLMAQAGISNVLGPFTGRLSNGGETIRLRDLTDRVMDEVHYGTDSDWPAGADGSGVSLAKKHPNLAGQPAENWTVSRQMGGTPGTANFIVGAAVPPLTGATTEVIPLAASWRFNDAGVDLGAEWRHLAYDDSAWAAGPAIFFAEDAPLPGPKNTPLTPGRNTYYFRTVFPFAGDPAMSLFKIRTVLDDGAVVYLNGAEVGRVNMPTGAVSYSTMALTAVPNAAWAGPFSIASSNLLVGQNVLAVELHQTTVVTNAGLRVSRAAGYTAAWDGDDGDFFSPGSPALAPTNETSGLGIGSQIVRSW